MSSWSQRKVSYSFGLDITNERFEKLVVPGVYGSYVKATCTNPTGLCQWLLRILTVREGYEHR